MAYALIIIAGIAFVCVPLTRLVGPIACMINPKSRFQDLSYRKKVQKTLFYICMGVEFLVLIALFIISRSIK